MATKPFLKPADLEEAERTFRPPNVVINGDESQMHQLESLSSWLGTKLLARLSAHPRWIEAGPIALGSWSRGELSPRSDIDLLFVGSEEAVGELTRDFAKEGVKLRYRMPEDREDWTVGVEPFDVLALFSAKPLASAKVGELAQMDIAAELTRQQLKIGRDWRRKILRAMVQERTSRAERFDSITNFLEPNLKYGSGGLRDLEQALALRALFPERFTSDDDQHAFEVLEYYKRVFLITRQKLHLSEGAGDLLTAPEQAPLAKWLGFKSSRDFMKEIQKGVARVSFYADWAFEKATSTRGRLNQVESRKLNEPKHLFEALKKDPSVLMQNRVRIHADRVFAKLGVRKELGGKKELNLLIGRELTSFIDPSKDEKPLIALFRSRLIDHCVPEFRKIVGHVQHDQYHRFSVDAHILQVLRELFRLRKTAGKAASKSKLLARLTKQDWEILSFACLYHDIAKGREGDHSTEGLKIAEHDLAKFGKPASLIKEVSWIVEEHLILSNAAFRENPSSPKTWAKLTDKGVTKKRAPLLAAFTIVDIKGTNPEAWTPWKERLLNEVVEHLENPESLNAIEFARLAPEWTEQLDSFVVSMLSPKKLAEDLEQTSKRSQPPKILKIKGQTWIRFHSPEDQSGLFAKYVGALSASGLSVRHASIHTFKDIGVYDWFEVKSEKTPQAIAKLLTLALEQKPKTKQPVVFDTVKISCQSQDEWVVSFKGKDQPGALLQAANALNDAGAEITWARVHTWGRQIDDVFGIKPPSVAAADFIARISSIGT